VSQVPGGRAAEVFSAKWILFASVALNIVPTLLTPPAAMMHWSVLVVLRIIEGVGGVSNALMYIVQFICSVIPPHINTLLHYFNVCLYFLDWDRPVFLVSLLASNTHWIHLSLSMLFVHFVYQLWKPDSDGIATL
jgi:hypothetical protein